MIRLFLIFFLFSANLLLAQTQDVRAAGDKMPQLRKKNLVVTPALYAGRQIMIGSGGGFTGASTTYYLLENGKLFGRRSRDTTFTFIGQQTAANTKRVFSSVETSCKIKTTKFDEPGNTYKFVQWRKGKLAYKVTWGAAGKTVPANYPKVYNAFMAMIPASLRLK
ncbi:hypothetical protein GCM10028805_33950 [Spirosoma harenae]